ncbi:SMI1/KNR4 family protein [Streptomyces termitum]|uniref:SMI1/KNR4 family protein n=1 Tax=Streptomyces termitum TaxID=67368 RepID=UPI0033A5808F
MDRAGTEAALGTALPADYRRLVETYGCGVFDETVRLLVPGADRPDHDLLPQTAEREEILRSLWDFADEEPPAELAEPGSRLVPWAFEEGSGAFLHRLVRPGRHPDTWTVLYNEGRGPLWEAHGTGCAAVSTASWRGPWRRRTSATCTRCASRWSTASSRSPRPWAGDRRPGPRRIALHACSYSN